MYTCGIQWGQMVDICLKTGTRARWDLCPAELFLVDPPDVPGNGILSH